MRCFIFASADIASYDWLKETDFKDAFIICADGGIKHAEALGVKVDVWIGDGDSAIAKTPSSGEVLMYPPQKDNTDTDLATELALKRGFKDITIVGALGGRLDHEYSHFCLLKKILDNGAYGCIVDEKNIITMENKPFLLENNGKKYVSFFPFGGDVKGFSVKGLKYEADGITLECGKVQASSNSFEKEDAVAQVNFDSGYVLVICSED